MNQVGMDELLDIVVEEIERLSIDRSSDPTLFIRSVRVLDQMCRGTHINTVHSGKRKKKISAEEILLPTSFESNNGHGVSVLEKTMTLYP